MGRVSFFRTGDKKQLTKAMLIIMLTVLSVAFPFFKVTPAFGAGTDLGSLTIDLRSGVMQVGSEKILEDISSTLSSMTEDNRVAFMYDVPYNLGDIDYNMNEDISLGWNSETKKYEIRETNVCSINGEFILRVNDVEKAYLKKEGYDYYSQLVFRFREASPMTVKGKSAAVKYTALKKKSRKLGRGKILKITKATGALSYKLDGVNKTKYASYFRINEKTGKLTIRKGLKKGLYKLQITVTAAGDAAYRAFEETVTCKIRIR